MEHSRHIGRVGALAVALGVGFAVASGAVAQAAPDEPDGANEVSGGGAQSPPATPDDAPLLSTPTSRSVVGSDPPTSGTSTSKVGSAPDANVGHSTVVIHHDPTPADSEDEADETTGLAEVADEKEAEPSGAAPSAPERVGHRSATTVTTPIDHTPPSTGTKPAVSNVPEASPTIARTARTAEVPEVLARTVAFQSTAAAVSLVSAKAAAPALSAVPPVFSTPSPIRFVLNFLNAIGLRPEAFPASSPLAPIGSLLEFVYAGLRRIDHALFNEAPTGIALVAGADPYTGAPLGTDAETGVVTGRVAYDPDDPLKYTLIAGPEHGEVTFNPDGTFTYTPDRNQTLESGDSDAFTVTVSDATSLHLHLFGTHTTTVDIEGISLPPNNTVIGTVGTGGQPQDLATNAAGTRVYVTDQDVDAVHVIDTATNTIVASIPVSFNPDGLAVVKTIGGGEYVYVASSQGVLGDPMNVSDDIVTVIDTSTNTVFAKINLSPTSVGAQGLQEVAASSDGTKVYVTGFNAVHVIDTATNTQTTVIPMSSVSNSIAVARTESGDFAYVADYDNKVTVINMATNAKVTTVSVAGFNSNVAASSDGRYVYVSGDGVTVIDTETNTVVATIDDVTDPRGLSVSPDGSRLYVTRVNFDEVAVIDTETRLVLDDIPLENAWNIVASPDGTRAYAVAFVDDPNVSVIALLPAPA